MGKHLEKKHHTWDSVCWRCLHVYCGECGQQGPVFKTWLTMVNDEEIREILHYRRMGRGWECNYCDANKTSSAQ